MKFIVFLSSALIGLFAAAATAQQSETEFTYSKTPVKGAITMLHGAGGNIGVLQGEEGLLVIDDGFARNSDALTTALASFGAKAQFVLNTHWHGDHTGANAALGAATIMAHENVRVRLAKGATFGSRVIEPAAPEALPDITYTEGTNLYFAGQTVSAVHLPNGHTDGDTIVFFSPANVVHMGDMMFAGRFPFIDPGSGGSVDGYIKNVGAIIEKIDSDTIVIPGHGDITDLKGLMTFHGMMKETRAAVAEMKANGKSLEQAQEAGLDEKWQDWSWGFIDEKRWIAILWNGIN